MAIWDGKPQTNPREAALQDGGSRALLNPLQRAPIPAPYRGASAGRPELLG